MNNKNKILRKEKLRAIRSIWVKYEEPVLFRNSGNFNTLIISKRDKHSFARIGFATIEIPSLNIEFTMLDRSEFFEYMMRSEITVLLKIEKIILKMKRDRKALNGTILSEIKRIPNNGDSRTARDLLHTIRSFNTK